MRTQGQPARQGYNVHAAVNEHQIILAAEITIVSPDFGYLEPMVDATRRELEAAGVAELPGTVVADPGYWHKQQMESVVSRGIQVLIPPDSGLRKTPRPGWDKGLYAFMRLVLSTDHGQAVYRRRMATVEPVFGQLKHNRGFQRFLRRGRSAVRSEWRLEAATHNLLNLHNHQLVATGPDAPETAKSAHQTINTPDGRSGQPAFQIIRHAVKASSRPGPTNRISPTDGAGPGSQTDFFS